MVTDKYYDKQSNVDYHEFHFKHRRNTNSSLKIHCLEEVKNNYLKYNKAIFKKYSKDIEIVYSKDICQRWINFLKNSFIDIPFDYEINDDYHTITLDYNKYDNVFDLYISLILMRYLWYKENNFLIYRIFDIIEKTNSRIRSNEAINLAHFYDDITRSSIFNIYNGLLINITADIYNYKKVNLYQIQKSYIDQITLGSLCNNPDMVHVFSTLISHFMTGDYIKDYQFIREKLSKLIEDRFSMDYSIPFKKADNTYIFEHFKKMANNLFKVNVKLNLIEDINQIKKETLVLRPNCELITYEDLFLFYSESNIKKKCRILEYE